MMTTKTTIIIIIIIIIITMCRVNSHVANSNSTTHKQK